MLKPGAEVFLQFPNETADRILHHGQIVKQSNGVFAAVFDESEIAPEPGQELLIYSMPKHEFMQQSARIVEAPVEASPVTDNAAGAKADESDGETDGLASPGNPPIYLVTVGDPVSAESRECYRVIAILTNRIATLDDEEGCKLLDVSATGLSLISTRAYCIGDIVTATLTEGREHYSGLVTVKSIKQLDGERTRYGLYCADDGKSDGNFNKGIQKVSTAVQREQLRRLNRAA